eukprot:UN34752
MQKNHIIRVQTASGEKRVTLKNDQCTLGELQKQIDELFKIPTELQLISTTPLHNPKFIEASTNLSLKTLGLKHGQRIYLDLDAKTQQRLNQTSAVTFSSKSRTKRIGDLPPENLNPLKHCPFEFWMKQKQLEYKNQPWNLDKLQDDYRPLKYGKEKN